MSQQHYLIGFVNCEIASRHPPTLRQLMQNLLYNQYERHLSKNESAVATINLALVVWNKLGIKTKRVDYLIETLKKHYNEYQSLKKNITFSSTGQIRRRQNFVELLDKEFNARKLSNESFQEPKPQTGSSKQVGMHAAEGTSSSRRIKRSSSMQAMHKIKEILEKRSRSEKGEL